MVGTLQKLAICFTSSIFLPTVKKCCHYRKSQKPKHSPFHCISCNIWEVWCVSAPAILATNPSICLWLLITLWSSLTWFLDFQVETYLLSFESCTWGQNPCLVHLCTASLPSALGITHNKGAINIYCNYLNWISLTWERKRNRFIFTKVDLSHTSGANFLASVGTDMFFVFFLK